MDRFVQRQNLEHFRKLLAATKDETQRQILEKMIVEEQAREPIPLPKVQ